MKWPLLFFALIGLAGLTLGYTLDWIPDGFICPRDPFYQSAPSAPVSYDFLHIWHPENITYYHNTLLVNFTLYNTTGDTLCWYLENGAGPNLFNCSLGLNNQTITFPAGSVFLEVYANDTTGAVCRDNVTFTVVLFHGRVGGEGHNLGLFVVLVLVLTISGPETKKRRPP
jgi:hypothetical protein